MSAVGTRGDRARALQQVGGGGGRTSPAALPPRPGQPWLDGRRAGSARARRVPPGPSAGHLTRAAGSRPDGPAGRHGPGDSPRPGKGLQTAGSELPHLSPRALHGVVRRGQSHLPPGSCWLPLSLGAVRGCTLAGACSGPAAGQTRDGLVVQHEARGGWVGAISGRKGSGSRKRPKVGEA